MEAPKSLSSFGGKLKVDTLVVVVVVTELALNLAETFKTTRLSVRMHIVS